MKSRLATTVGLCALAAAGAVAYGAVQGATASNSAEPSEALVAAVPALGEAQVKTDELPDFLAHGEQSMPDLELHTSRFLGAVNDVKTWVAVNGAGEGCLITLLPGEGEFAGMSCASAAAIWQGKLTLEVKDASDELRATLVPAPYDLHAAPLKVVGDNLLVDTSLSSTPAFELRAPTRAVAGHGDPVLEVPKHESMASAK
ncbi:MAG: hypothetical protein NTV28_08215 [Propionibacteriales bacterium]|nr:hypothetical protein [Propionibacteriales bacterium]